MDSATTAKLYDVVVVGAGAAGLQTAAILLQQQPSLSIAILERNASAGGRIRDIQFAEGIESIGIGAWRIASENTFVLDLLQRHGVPIEPWAFQPKRFESRGACVNSAEELRLVYGIEPESELGNLKPSNVPDFLQRTLAKSLEDSANSPTQFPTRLGDVMRESLGLDGEQFLSAISHGYKGLKEYNLDLFGTLSSANAGSGLTRPQGGMSQIIKILENECTSRGAVFHYRANVLGVRRSGSNYDITYATTRGGARSDTLLSAHDDTLPILIKARNVVLAVPPRAISRMLDQSPSDDDVLSTLVAQPKFRSCLGIPIFRAAALYSRAWWDDDAQDGLQNLGERGTLLSSSSHLSLLMPYAGRGPNGEAALHLSYCNDYDARHGGFWDQYISNALSQSDADHQASNLDAIFYHTIREELAKAFVVPAESIPDPIKLEWHYWDDGGVHVQQPTEGASISRREVEDWAVSGPLDAERIVLVGEGFSEKWAWVEGAVVSATRGAETVLRWMKEAKE